MPFQKAHSARKMAQNWYARANPGIFRNICTSSIFLQHGLFLNSNHKKGLQVSGCGKSLRCFSLQKWITAYICADLCMRGGCRQCGSSQYLQNFSSYSCFLTFKQLSEGQPPQSNRGKGLAACPDTEHRKDIKLLGTVQRRTTKMVNDLDGKM